MAKWATDGSTDIADAAFESRYKTEHLRFSVLPALWVNSRVHEWIGLSWIEGRMRRLLSAKFKKTPGIQGNECALGIVGGGHKLISGYLTSM